MSDELYDPRTFSKSVYKALSYIWQKHQDDRTRLKEQYKQSVELYSYLATWGMLRLKAEEQALNQDGKKDIVVIFFKTLQELSGQTGLEQNQGLDTLSDMEAEDYLGLTGLGLQIAREFAFWATAVYADVKAEAEAE
ncbi:hypothetical protein [Moorena sp. SIO3H5]|uniref:hypothetical protein n=1 Tax=Moorena sp. SIO3H5 TaxID=2607834 RepID=UPI0013B6BD6F|nr:hypothetical protein [Moorena sp. SIO3H5]NEO72183.1 hypothetical protein [Moorena sp. SIO3H5]